MCDHVHFLWVELLPNKALQRYGHPQRVADPERRRSAQRMNTKIRIAQVRVVPEKGNLKGNHEKLMAVLNEVARETVDVVVTPECFLDGYIATQASVSAEQLSPSSTVEPVVC